MKCTYRVLMLIGTTVCVLLMLGINGDLAKLIYIRGVKEMSGTGSAAFETRRLVIGTEDEATNDDKKLIIHKSEKNLSSYAAKLTSEVQLNIQITATRENSDDKKALSSIDLGIRQMPERSIENDGRAISNNPRMVLAVVCCGDRANETRTMLKSVAALSYSSLLLVVFTEENLKPLFREMHDSWPPDIQQRIQLDLYSITFPPGQDAVAWRKLFKPCASQRLFMPSLLKDIDSLIYVDTDVLFLAPVEEVWKHFQAMNSSQMAAMAPEHEDLATGWYNRFAKHPYYGRLGVNSGVMLMNLTRLRKFGWEDYVVPIYKHYKLAITWGDQDIINIIFHYHPDKLYVYGCEYNLRPDHCMYMSVCKVAEKRGVYVLHGNRGTFHSDKQPAFWAVYKAWEEYQLGEDLRQDLYYPMQRYLLKASNTTCGKIYNAFLKVLGSRIRLR